MQARKGRTKSDLSDKVFNKYFTIWPRFGTGYFRFGPIYPDLVIRVTEILGLNLGHLTSNILKMVSRSITCLLDFAIFNDPE